MLTCNSPSTLGRRVSQCFDNKYALHLTDPSDYYGIFNVQSKTRPRNILGRGLVLNEGIHEFQTASIVDDEHSLNEHVLKFTQQIVLKGDIKATPIPSLPEKVTLDIIEKDILTLEKVPIGISKDSLKIVKYDFQTFASTCIISNRLNNINSFIDSLLDVFIRINGLTVMFIDTLSLLPNVKEKNINGKKINYFNSNFEVVLDKLIEFVKNPNNDKFKVMYIFYGIERLKTKTDVSKLETLFDEVKNHENSKVIFCDSGKGIKTLDYDSWFAKIKNNTDGIWIGKGLSEQQNFRISKITKEMTKIYPNNYGFCLVESNAELIKLLEFNDLLQEDDGDEE